MPTAQDAAPHGPRGMTLRAPLRALVLAVPVVFTPRILAVVLLPLVAAAGIWTVVGWIAWSPLTQWLGATIYGAHGGWSDFAAGASAALLLMLAAVLTALVAVAVLAMPVIVDTVAQRDYPSLAKLRGGTFAGGLVNAVATVLLFLPLWLLALLLLPLPPIYVAVSLLQSAWLNQRLFRIRCAGAARGPRRAARRDRGGAPAPVRPGTHVGAAVAHPFREPRRAALRGRRLQLSLPLRTHRVARAPCVRSRNDHELTMDNSAIAYLEHNARFKAPVRPATR